MDSTPTPPAGQAEFEAMVRRYLAKMGLRYAPVIVGAVLLLLVLLLVPTTQPLSSNLGSGGLSGGTGLSTGGGSSLTAGGTSGGTAGGSTNPSAPGATAGTGASSGGAGAGGSASGTGGGSGPVQSFSGAQGSTSGVSKNGTTCGPGVRQFTWSGHSPNCEAAFTGNNGGATGQGVTASTITLTFRVPNSADDQAIAAAAGSANVNYSAMTADMQTYINFFNKQFELYGRHVVLKVYNGQGDYIQEDQGQDLQGAQADAISAHNMGAFGDVTFSLGASQAYEQDLAQEHVMSFSSVAQPQSFYQQYFPYQWSVQGASGENGVKAAAAVVCRREAGMPAIFAGDAVFQKTTRVFGIIYPETPNYTAEANQYKSLLQQQCGQGVKDTEAYAINVAQYTNEATTIMAKFNSERVTTVLCACDPIFPIFLSQAASGQNYNPEWDTADFGDPVTQDYNQNEWSHSFAGGTPFGAPTQTEAYKVYEMANPGHQPAEGGSTSPPYYYVPYYTVLHVFEGLQAAGPDLNAANFAQGMFSLPPSVGTDPIGGKWEFGSQVYDPVVSFGLVYWSPNTTSSFDNKAGSYVACNSGQIYTVDNLAALGGPKEQLHCFGK